IVDIVETGATLRENGLVVYEEISDIIARLVANKAAYKFKAESINNLLASTSRFISENAK
ncbi:MAG: ATP phosphoribosyltransferase, partial [Clostridia bacterium]|nr:ATP phosphoribosyltransferase [Clostridia bacterium]